MILIPILIYLAGAFLDGWSSKDGKYYGLNEANKLYADKNKDYIWWRDAIVSGIVCVILAVVGTHELSAALGFAGLAGGARAMMFFFNGKNAKNNRVKQIEILTKLHNMEVVSVGMVAHRNGKAFFSLFRYLAVPEVLDGGGGVDDWLTQVAVIEALNAEARKDPKDWFGGK